MTFSIFQDENGEDEAGPSSSTLTPTVISHSEGGAPPGGQNQNKPDSAESGNNPEMLNATIDSVSSGLEGVNWKGAGTGLPSSDVGTVSSETGSGSIYTGGGFSSPPDQGSKLSPSSGGGGGGNNNNSQQQIKNWSISDPDPSSDLDL